MNLSDAIDVDLPSLQSIRLGLHALQGRNISSCSLKMRSMNNMIVMICFIDLPNLTCIDNSQKYSFYEPRVVTLESLYLTIEYK